MTFRRIIFRLHLFAGIVAVVVIAVMSFTGAVLAFGHGIAWRRFFPRSKSAPLSG